MGSSYNCTCKHGYSGDGKKCFGNFWPVQPHIVNFPSVGLSLPLTFCLSYCFKSTFKNVHSPGEHLKTKVIAKFDGRVIGGGGGGGGGSVPCGFQK